MAVDPDKSIYVSNLPVYPLAELEDLLYELFLQVLIILITMYMIINIVPQAGPLNKVYIPYDKTSGDHKGYAFVEFRDSVSVPYTCKLMHGIQLLGFYIAVKPATVRNNELSSDGRQGDETTETINVGHNQENSTGIPQVMEESPPTAQSTPQPPVPPSYPPPPFSFALPQSVSPSMPLPPPFPPPLPLPPSLHSPIPPFPPFFPPPLPTTTSLSNQIMSPPPFCPIPPPTTNFQLFQTPINKLTPSSSFFAHTSPTAQENAPASIDYNHGLPKELPKFPPLPPLPPLKKN